MKRSLFLALGSLVLVLSVLVISIAVLPTLAASPTSIANQGRRVDVALTFPNSQHITQARTSAGNVPADAPTARDEWFYGLRIAGNPSVKFTLAEAAALRAQAAATVITEKAQQQAGNLPQQYAGSWSGIGPDPIVQVGFSSDFPFVAMAGRIGALAIRSSPPYTIYLGAAQGGMWISSTLTSGWIPKTDQLASLAIGAIALAPSNEDIVYVGTGEGALSGDSYFGNGILKSTDGGRTFSHISGTAFNQVSISSISVDPADADHLYVATLRGRGGNRRVTPPFPTPYGIWESTDGGASWTPRLVTSDQLKGATGLVMDPLNPKVLYAAFWGDGIVKSVDGGLTWHEAMNGLPPDADYTVAPTRFALGISHPTASISATLYAGFEWYDTEGNYHPSTVWKSNDEATSWSEANTDVVGGYCGSSPGAPQCFYDNVIGVNPTDPDIVYALGLFDYKTGTGGIFRSTDGGASWVNLGWHQHPDYHAIAIRRDSPGNIVVGNDGGVWSSANYGGRLSANDPITATDWVNLNGTVDPTTAEVLATTGLQITQFQSVAQNPSIIALDYGGNQDNGTLRKSTRSETWYDLAGGDGGQVLVDPIDPSYVYGTYYGLSPYRFSDGMSSFFSNQSITTGITTTERSAFYIPFIMDPADPSRLYLGSFRVYRTDNRGDLWKAISLDLTSGCTSGRTSPTGFECVLTALGATAGAPALYTGSGDGQVYISLDATANSPTWIRVDKAPLPVRPVSAFAVDRSNYRLAYVAFAGFNAATPTRPGHVFKTTDGGETWVDISGNLPDVPVNSLVLDASRPDTLYAGTDVGPMFTTNGGATWLPLGTDFPIVTVHQLSLNPYTGLLAAATHGRGAWILGNPTPKPALQIRKQPTDVPVGPGSLLTYTVIVENIGNAPATGVIVRDPVPAHTTFVAADSGGILSENTVTWMVTKVATGTPTGDLGGVLPGRVSLNFAVRVDEDQASGSVITNDGFPVSSAENVSANGSPTDVTLAPAYDLAVTPSSQFDGTRSGQAITYTMAIQNLGYNNDVYDLSVAGNSWPTTLWDAGFSTQITHTDSLAPGEMAEFGVRVTVPVTATNGMTDTASVTATSAGDPMVSRSATIETRAVTVLVLMVDGDNDAPDVTSYYAAALESAGYSFDSWDLLADSDLPLNFMQAHNALVWFTGASYPGPLLPYQDKLAAYLDSGGSLFLSGMDILDQAAGTTPFVRNYLYVNWDGTERQNDIGTNSVTGVMTNPVTSGVGTLSMDYAAVGLNDYSDEITLISPAIPAFLDDRELPDALTVAAGRYRVMFMAFPFEAMGTPADRADVLGRALKYFTVSPTFKIYFPLVARDYGAP